MAAKKKVKKATQRIPKYVDEDGLYLAIDDRDYIIKIGWYDPEEGEFGLYLCNEHYKDTKAGAENNIAIDTVKDYFRENGIPIPGGYKQDFEFDKVTEARKVLRIINAKLHYMRDNKPMPDWAKKAIEEGWSPPKGWKP